MADTTRDNIVVDRQWVETTTSSKGRIGKKVRLTNGTFGGTTNKILASSMGLSVIESCSPAVREDDSIVYLTCPSYDGSALFLINLEQATDASRGDPADVTLTSAQFLKFEVHGY